MACNPGSGASSSALYRPPPPPSQGGLPPPGGLPPVGGLPPFAGGYPSSRNQWVPPMGGLPPPAYLAGNNASSSLQSLPMKFTTMCQSHIMPSIHGKSTVCAPTMHKFEYCLDGHLPDACVTAESLLLLAVLQSGRPSSRFSSSHLNDACFLLLLCMKQCRVCSAA